MKNDETSHGKSQEKPSRARPQTEEDLDFEILDALENIDHSGSSASALSTNQGDDFDLDLDDDLVFDDEAVEDTAKFSIDADMAAEFASEVLSEDDQAGELAQEAAEPGFDIDIEDDVPVNENDTGSFVLDFNEDADDIDLAFDDEIDLNLDSDFKNSAFAKTSSGRASSDEEEDGASSLEFDSDLSEDQDFAMQGSADDEVAEDEDESFDDEGVGEGDEIDIDNMPDLDETMAELTSALESEPSALDRDDDQSDMELADMKKAQENEEFSGKSVFSIDGEQVIDLGDEDDISSISDADNAAWDSDDDLQADDDFFDDGDEDDFFDDEEIGDDAELAELAKGAQQVVDQNIDEESDEQTTVADTDFMASLNDIQIDLHDDDADEYLETLSNGDDHEFDLPEDAATAAEDFDVPSLSEVLADIQEESGIDEGFEAEPSAAPESVLKSQEDRAAEAETEIDVREALGLVPRLADQDVHKFDEMILEAKTLQQYIEELETHKPEIKTAIYMKLLKEYNTRKANIFREPDFISIRIDVEQDLEDMVRKQNEVQRTISNLNDELEEIRVRHLVGEYSDVELADQEQSRKTEIDAWQSKTDRLGRFIAQYQELLESEKALNPLEEESDAAIEPPAPLDAAEVGVEMETSAVPDEFEALISGAEGAFDEAPVHAEAAAEEESPMADLASMIGDDDFADEDVMSEDEGDSVDEGFPFEDEIVDTSEAAEEPDEIADLGDLTGIVEDDEGGDWDDEDAEDLELTAENFDDDFSLDADFSDNEELTGLNADELELNGLTDLDHTDDDTLGALDFGRLDQHGEAASEQDAEMVSCKKCGRSTPASEKFCVNCGAKAR